MNPDLAIFHLVNAWCGTPLLDRAALFADEINLFKSGIIISAYWWFWSAGDEKSLAQRRKAVALALLATFAAIIISRLLAVVLPFRVRPMYTSGIGYHAPSIHIAYDMERWSSFPSDHAAMFFALSYGLWRLNRWVGVAAMVFSTAWVCLVRLYLGIHYPSDLLAGALIGIDCGWVAFRLPSQPLTSVVQALERRHPGTFYATAFVITYETADQFDDVRKCLHGLRLLDLHQQELLAAVGTATALALGASVVVVGRNRAARMTPPQRVSTARNQWGRELPRQASLGGTDLHKRRT